MNSYIKNYTTPLLKTWSIGSLFVAASLLIVSCGNSVNKEEGEELEEEHVEEVHFSTQQFQSLRMKVDTLPLRNISSYVDANGQLEVPPQNEAAVTAVIGANIISIKVIEGDKIKKGQVLAYLNHPDLIKLQTDYINSWNQLQYIDKEYQRQKKLYDEKVGSGKEFQKTQADYQSMKGTVVGYEAQLRLLGLSLMKIQQGEIYDQVPVSTPISGYVRHVNVKTGQYVQPQTEMFEIVNIDHIHTDLMVFEKDMHKVKEGQKVKFSIESLPGKELEATIYSVGKAFEQDPKAIHLHAEIHNKEGLLIPGMYVRGRIIIDDVRCYALPEAAVIRDGDKYFIFTAEKKDEDGEVEWEFVPEEIIVGAMDNGWIEVKLLQPLEEGTTVAWNNAYYLLAEMKKGELGDDD
ncbi:MAG: efflux transporter periplasmic adaptor subunit [Flammeovirgaceae bacterium]|jgi:membrane fusion protein, heavy metal efflux system|nr:efflux transporter periplasmic adaptor subunit [Flammeovirgaceae bacterium]MBE63273.1 efflux transporter periplasmic adaptor subunit [Flammeovirgaceae bacterium]HCX21932.1 efflux transporter periplasmic adaptor subunit [Cytophagales bacterium]|tara:strand:+ start:4337 stop:5551 length:1215 start_codon:yes stop_codon:yes gene_type:complete